MKTSYNEACARDCSTLEQDLVLCEKAGFDYIEIRIDMLREWLNSHKTEELREYFASHRLKPHAINAVYLQREMLNDEEPDWNTPTMQDLKTACEVGNAIGSEYIIVVPPFDPSGIFSGDVLSAEKDCIRILKKLSKIVRVYGMRICFELVGLKKSCVRSIKAANRIVEGVGEDNVGFVFDSYNIYLNGQCNQFDDIKTVNPKKIFAVHLMSADDVPEEEMGQDKRRFPGEGVVDTNAFLRTLKECGYTGMVSVETFRPEYWKKTPDWVIANAYEATYKALEINDCL